MIFTINVGGISSEDIGSFVEAAKESLTGGGEVERFFGSEPLCYFIPSREAPTKIEVLEFVLDGEGQKKYEMLLKDKNPLTIKTLDALKEMINDCK